MPKKIFSRFSFEKKLVEYQRYLQEVRCLAAPTIRKHSITVLEFLNRFNNCGGLSYLSRLTPQDIDGFICDLGKRLKRGSLQHSISHLRSFLRFLAGRGEAPITLYSQIDAPCVYKEEKLPRALDWEVVCALLNSIDRSTAIGKRDYAILLLIATYGLRTSEIVSLTLDDIDWRTNRLKIIQKKTATTLILPLTDATGESIIDYLRQGRPSIPSRQIFVRHKAPEGALVESIVSGIFCSRVLRSGLLIPFRGPHCLRHSYAVHLLRQGISLKTIADILGHHNLASTCIYLRLAVEDLRTVPLLLPISPSSTQEGVLS